MNEWSRIFSSICISITKEREKYSYMYTYDTLRYEESASRSLFLTFCLSFLSQGERETQRKN